MHLIKLDQLTLNYGGRDIFQGLSWAIPSAARIGLVGPNGAGKSSLFKLLAGQVTPVAGYITLAKGVTVGYLPQEVALPPRQRLIEAALTLPPALAEVEQTLAKLESKLADPAIYGDEGKLTRVLDQQEQALARYEALGGPQHHGKVRAWLTLFGFSPADDDLLTETLSGGQKKLIALIQLAMSGPSVLLLDEPDNHLDMAGKARLEKFIHQYEGAVVIISHDRYLLDEVAQQIDELESGKLTSYPGNYSAYSRERELRRLRQQQQYVAQQKEIARIETAIARFELWASLVVDERHIKQARSRRKMLERMEANGEIIEKVTERKRMDLQLEGWRGSQLALQAFDLSMAFDEHLIFEGLNFTLRHGERVGLVGENGAGKSVLFRLITGQYQPFDGEIRLGPSVQLSYYSQEHERLAPWLDRTPLELIRDLAPKSEESATAFLLKFLFSYEQTRLPIRTFSGGERSRLQLAAMMLERPNFLLLDEPTNNLDIASVEVLEEVLEDFEGTVLVISHDRYFLDQVVDGILELKDGCLHRYQGNYTDYAEQVR
jgi:ATP-binding cassette subfamily F protein 3